jgi:hypothetical protein
MRSCAALVEFVDGIVKEDSKRTVRSMQRMAAGELATCAATDKSLLDFAESIRNRCDLPVSHVGNAEVSAGHSKS